jgi:tetratricopeptide (TPR) repeat protein
LGDLSQRALYARALSLKRERRFEAALAVEREAVLRFGGVAAWHNLSATLMDVGRAEEARAALDEAFRRGGDAPETWYLSARIDAALGRNDEAERGFIEVLRRRPGHAEAALSLSRLRWMATGSFKAAAAPVELALRACSDPTPLLLAYGRLLEADGAGAELADLLYGAIDRFPGNVALLCSASDHEVARGRTKEGLDLARRAAAIERCPASLSQLCAALTARGRAGLALRVGRLAADRFPDDQGVLCWLATAARAAGADPFPAALDDRIVQTRPVAPPSPFASREDWLHALRASLLAQHRHVAAPYDQSVVGGVQTSADLRACPDPVVRSLFRALEAPIDSYLRSLGEGSDAVRRRNTGKAIVLPAWSVRLSPGGWHKDHFHPAGWVSAVLYVSTPASPAGDATREGWLRFGKPPFPLPGAAAEHFVRPEPGMLVLFPSYLWHGVIPFAEGERLTVAFDLAPAPAPDDAKQAAIVSSAGCPPWGDKHVTVQ